MRAGARPPVWTKFAVCRFVVYGLIIVAGLVAAAIIVLASTRGAPELRSTRVTLPNALVGRHGRFRVSMLCQCLAWIALGRGVFPLARASPVPEFLGSTWWTVLLSFEEDQCFSARRAGPSSEPSPTVTGESTWRWLPMEPQCAWSGDEPAQRRPCSSGESAPGLSARKGSKEPRSMGKRLDARPDM